MNSQKTYETPPTKYWHTCDKCGFEIFATRILPQCWHCDAPMPDPQPITLPATSLRHRPQKLPSNNITAF